MSASWPMRLTSNAAVVCGKLPAGLLAASLCVLPTAGAGDTSAQAQQLINEMSRASRELNYDGIFVYRYGRRMDTMRLIHRADAGGERERMVSLTGVAREVIRDGASVTCYFPDNQSVMVEKGRTRKLLNVKLPEPIEKVADYYTFSVGSQDRIAGRTTIVVNIVPKDGYRYGYQLWLDEQTKLLLKSELKNTSGWPVEQILFTRLDVADHIPDELLAPAISGRGYTWYTGTSPRMNEQAGDGEWKVTWLPAGFVMRDYEKQAIASSSMPVEHMVYSDGLAMVSVFVEKLGNNPDIMEGASSMGGINAFATLANGYQVTAVGEVPQQTVQQMASSVIRGR